jgi:hypothetical protein
MTGAADADALAVATGRALAIAEDDAEDDDDEAAALPETRAEGASNTPCRAFGSSPEEGVSHANDSPAAHASARALDRSGRVDASAIIER